MSKDKRRRCQAMLVRSTVSFVFPREKQVLKIIPVLLLSVLIFCASSLRAAGSAARSIEKSTSHQQQLYSPSISREFYEMAYELANAKDAAGPEVEQAMAFLTAAMRLDESARDVQRLLIELACRKTGWDYSNLVYSLLVDYVDENTDLDVAKSAVDYLLYRMNSREQREKFLEQMLGTLGSENEILGSELAVKLGMLKAEKGDSEAAEYYLMQAYKSNRYNWQAFAKLAEIKPELISPVLHLERLRLAIRENPSEIEVAISFAEETERLQLYDISSQAYKYCADLFDYLYPSESLPARIYLPWAISSYNSVQSLSQCQEIAKRVRQEGGFDLRLESIAAKAAIKMGDTELASLIFRAIEDKTQRLLKLQGPNINATGSAGRDGGSSQQDYNTQLAWFYSFVLPDPTKALSWANKAFAVEPNSPVTASILAYALTMNNQIEWAKPLVGNFEKTQIAGLTQAIIQLSQGQNDRAVETLSSAIAKDPGSFAAERAKEILTQQGKEYVPPAETKTVLPTLEKVFGPALVPEFTAPEKLISVQLQIRGSVFAYGSEFNAVAAVTNLSSEPIVISDYSMFKGYLRVDAVISGDLSKNIPNLVSTRIQGVFLIEPGRTILVPLRLITGELRNTLFTYPQASIGIEFTLYFDPVIKNDGTVVNRISHIEPSRVSIKRPGIELTAKYLRDEFNSIPTAPADRKIKIAQLFTGLLKEQYAMSNREPLYRFMYADWMTPLFRSSLTHKSGLLLNPGEDEWTVKVCTMADMISLPMDHELISTVAEDMNHPKWPVRLMAIYLLNTIPDNQFEPVLTWTAQNDPSKAVRDMALVLASDLSNRREQL
jgi:tetratricopeptide (TPR) repeat protein